MDECKPLAPDLIVVCVQAVCFALLSYVLLKNAETGHGLTLVHISAQPEPY